MSPSSSWWDTPINIDETATTPREWLQTAYLRMSDVAMAEALSKALGRRVLANRVTLMRQRQGLQKTTSGQPVVFQESTFPKFNEPPTVQADDVLVLADVEVPFQDAAWCSDVVALAHEWGIKTVILAGDFLHLDSLSSFAKRFLALDETEPELSAEIEAGGLFADRLLTYFDKVVMVLGNHEARLLRRLELATSVKILQRLLGQQFNEERFVISPYYHAVIEASTGQWRVTHPKEARKIPLTAGRELAEKYLMNVIAAHGHDWGETTSPSGRYVAACGCCVDPARLDYAMLRDSTRPVMQQGAFILRNGQPVLLHPKYAPPSMWL